MLFILRKTIAFLLMPFPVSFAFCSIGTVLLWSRQRKTLGRILLSVGTGLLLIFSNGAFARWMVSSLESQYQALPNLPTSDTVPAVANVRFIAVLGGGHTDISRFSPNNKLNPAALARLVEGVRLARALPEARLVLSGGGYDGGPSDAEIMKQAAVMLGVDPLRILQNDAPKDTAEEAVALQRVVGTERFILVTTALHMPRAVALMKHRGLNPVPAPVGFLTRPEDPFRFTTALWSSGALEMTSGAAYERYGMAWAWLQGRI